MSILSIIDAVLFRPLGLLFEIVYVAANKFIHNPGLSIIALSLVMNFLILPLYIRADAIQEEEKQMEKKLRRGVAHIKKTFRGDERMMMTQAYYKINGYKQTYVLRSAVSLLLEIPFFIAAYRFLSGLELLNGVRFGPIADLAKPDGLLTIGGTAINLLPIIMTAVNLISCVIFTKDSPLKTKIQLYAMALFFLFFLYSSPSGLVFYWTLNNIFSLIKTIFYKLKNPKKVLAYLAAICGTAAIVYSLFIFNGGTPFKKGVVALFGAVLILPLIFTYVKLPKRSAEEPKPDKKLFFVCALFLAVLTGITIPASVISSSPQEFLVTNPVLHPIWYIVNAFCIALGTFVVWLGVFYKLVKPRAKVIFERVTFILCAVFAVDYMFFGKGMGILSADLRYESGFKMESKEKIVNLAVIAATVAIALLALKLLKTHTKKITAVFLAALIVMAPIDIVKINGSVKGVIEQVKEPGYMPKITLSKSGKNVVVIMLDRAMGVYLPYIFNEKPELTEKFSGFTAYTNTVSYGTNTNFGAPALFGGYEYTPEEINKRDSEKLVDKHNEALKVMPALFSENGFKVTVIDPPYANYNWKTDISIFNGMENVSAYVAQDRAIPVEMNEYSINSDMRNFFCYSLMKSAPAIIQDRIYDDGRYYKSTEDMYFQQTASDSLHSMGLSKWFMSRYYVVDSMPELTEFSDHPGGTFLSMVSDLTHEPMLLQEPEYEPAEIVDNTEYETQHADRLTLDGKTLKVDTPEKAGHYQTNVAALLKLGEWFDFLKENEVYDNTRIILVSDHGGWLNQRDDLNIPNIIDIESFIPLLMVKDFGETEFKMSDEFMTNADVPTLATKGLIDDATNPFTGKKIDSSVKDEPVQYMFTSEYWDVEKNNGNTFLPGRWFTLTGTDSYDVSCWKLNAAEATLPNK
ncbi:MAG: membrane protein insertase YidC [Clostridia bacterium]|nr:membrane protein insertase YidC [Clostridia bacterium]